jgi:hypothetical protein
MLQFPNAGRFDACLLGDGLDITGRQVEYWGEIWTISGQNHLEDWDVERFETRSDGRYKIMSSISSEVLPETHGHFARLVGHS